MKGIDFKMNTIFNKKRKLNSLYTKKSLKTLKYQRKSQFSLCNKKTSTNFDKNEEDIYTIIGSNIEQYINPSIHKVMDSRYELTRIF